MDVSIIEQLRRTSRRLITFIMKVLTKVLRKINGKLSPDYGIAMILRYRPRESSLNPVYSSRSIVKRDVPLPPCCFITDDSESDCCTMNFKFPKQIRNENRRILGKRPWGSVPGVDPDEKYGRGHDNYATQHSRAA